MQTFEDLLVWRKAHELVLDVYRATERFPIEERYGLIAQMRRAAVSVPANIVEGHKRASKRGFSNFITIAEGSLDELKYYLILSRDLGYLLTEHSELLHTNAEEIGRMLHGLQTHIKEELTDATATIR